MNAKITTLKASLIALFLFASSAAWSATYYTCIGTALNLTAGTPATGTTYLWDVRQGGTSISGYPSATAPTSFPTAGSYDIILVNTTTAETGSCKSDPVENTVVVLPALALSLGTPTLPAYCASATTPSSDVASTMTGFPATYSTDLEAEYAYSVSKDGAAGVNGTTVGTIDAATGKYTLTTTTPGVYVITGTVKYKAKTGVSLLGTGCPSPVSNTETITVTAKPAAPTITITAAN